MRQFEPGWRCCRAPSTTATPGCVWPARSWPSAPAGSMGSDGGSTRPPGPGRWPVLRRVHSGAAAADCLRTVHAWLLGDLGACRAAGEAAICRATEPSPWDGVTYTWLGASQFWLGQRKEGLAALQEGLSCRGGQFLSALDRLPRHARPHPPPAGRPRRRARVLRGGTGAVGEGRTGRILQAHHRRPHHPGRPADRDGRAEEARVELQRVVEVAHRGSGPVEIAHAQVALSMAAQATGDPAAARALPWTPPDRSSRRAQIPDPS